MENPNIWYVPKPEGKFIKQLKELDKFNAAHESWIEERLRTIRENNLRVKVDTTDLLNVKVIVY